DSPLRRAWHTYRERSAALVPRPPRANFPRARAVRHWAVARTLPRAAIANPRGLSTTRSFSRRLDVVGALGGVGRRCRTDPCSVVVRLVARRETFPIARPLALYHAPELVPIDGADLPVLRRVIEPKLRIGN